MQIPRPSLDPQAVVIQEDFGISVVDVVVVKQILELEQNFQQRALPELKENGSVLDNPLAQLEMAIQRIA